MSVLNIKNSCKSFFLNFVETPIYYTFLKSSQPLQYEFQNVFNFGGCYKLLEAVRG